MSILRHVGQAILYGVVTAAVVIAIAYVLSLGAQGMRLCYQAQVIQALNLLLEADEIDYRMTPQDTSNVTCP